MFLWVANFRGLTVGFASLPTNFHRWIHMSNQEYRVFHSRGIYHFLLYPIHVFFISFFFYTTVRLILDVVQFHQAHHRTPNTVSIYHVLTTYHRTPKTVSISTMHLYPCHVMSHALMQCNDIACISCYMHNECHVQQFKIILHAKYHE